MLQLGKLFNENCMKFVKEETAKTNTHVVTMFDFRRG